MKTDVNVPSRSTKQKNLEKNTYFLLASCQPLTKKAGPASVSQWLKMIRIQAGSKLLFENA
jgi:hypothetical protein